MPPEMLPNHVAHSLPTPQPFVHQNTMAPPTAHSTTLIQPNQVATPGTTQAAVWEYILNQAHQMAHEPHVVVRTDPSQSGSGNGPSASEAIIVIGGTVVILHYLDRAMRALYYRAVYNSDERLMRVFPEREGLATNIWRAIGNGVSRIWVPLWANGEEIRQNAVRAAVDDAFTEVRIGNLERARHEALMRNLDLLDRMVPPQNNRRGDAGDQNPAPAAQPDDQPGPTGQNLVRLGRIANRLGLGPFTPGPRLVKNL